MRLRRALSLILGAFAIASPTANNLLSSPHSKCRSLKLTVSTAAENIRFTNAPDQNNATAIHQWLFACLTDSTGSCIDGVIHVGGKYSVEATYCAPWGKSRRQRALQVLVHGVTYNKEMWAGLGFSDAYNWHVYANRAGYHTIALNRLGHGQLSALPDPIVEEQSALQDKFMEDILIALRYGIADLPSFEKIIYVGHSFGAALGNHVARNNPGAVDAYVLTGYSSTVAIPINLTLDSFSAAIVNPSRFPGVPLGYWVGQTESVRTAAFYTGSFSPTLPHLDFLAQDTFAVGEGVSPSFEPRVTSFTGPVLVVTGELDPLFCPDGAVTCLATLERTGHTLGLHLSAPQMIKDVHGWLERYF